MHRVEEKTDELIEAIQESSEYIQYHRAYSELKKNKELFKRLNTFRRRRFEIEMAEREHSEASQKRLADEFGEVLAHPLAAQFLSAEYTYLRLVRQTTYRMNDGLGLDIDFLEEA
jgi:cell fate (sporulation/competence/biofilm development) regulator YlbF (YheA/YmcA/DUF963 family)